MKVDNKSPKELYAERMKRVYDAIELRVPDRVPIIPVVQAFIPHYSGITIQEMMNDYEKSEKANDKFFEDFDPDLAWDPVFMYPAKPLTTLGLRWFKWPGNGLEANTMFQFVEGEYMKAEEYDELIYDPTRFILSKWIPSCFSNLEGLKHLENLRDSTWLGFFSSFSSFSLPEVQDSLKSLIKGAKELDEWNF